MPIYATVFMIFMLGSVGLPGTSGFIGEFLVIVGSFNYSSYVVVGAAAGIILSAIYMLYLYKRIIFGRTTNNEIKNIIDLNKIEFYILISLAFFTLFFGFYPEPLLSTVDISINNLIDDYNLRLLEQNN